LFDPVRTVRVEGDDGPPIDPDDIGPDDIGPAGAAIAVAFTGALLAAVGVGLSLAIGRAGFAIAVMGIAVVLASPAAYWYVAREYGR
jgi:hypothetical protein